MENSSSPLTHPFSDSLVKAAATQSPDWLWIFNETGVPIGISPAVNAGIPLFPYVHEGDLQSLKNACQVLLELGQPFVSIFRVVTPEGMLIWLEVKGYPLDVEGQQAAALSGRDITLYKQQEERLTQLAYHDALTGLPNRRLFQDRFTQALHTAKRYHHKLAVLYLDLDNFKIINDTYGHSIGDELLSVAASRLSHSIREPDTICRMGGDEFVVLLLQFEHRDDVTKVCKRIGESLGQPYELSGYHIDITSSIGAAFYPEDGEDSETLLQCADAAMYASKQLGKSQFQFYTQHEGESE